MQFLVLIIFSDFVAIIVIAFIDFLENTSFLSSGLFSMEEEFFIFIMLFQLFASLFLFLSWIRNYYFFEEDVLVHRYGIFFVSQDQFHIEEVEMVRYSQTVLGRFLGYGRIHLFFANQKVIFSRISEPEKFVKIVKDYKKIKEL